MTTTACVRENGLIPMPHSLDPTKRIWQCITARQAWCLHPIPCAPKKALYRRDVTRMCRWEMGGGKYAAVVLRKTPDTPKRSFPPPATVYLHCDLHALDTTIDVPSVDETLNAPPVVQTLDGQRILVVDFEWFPRRPHLALSSLNAIALLPKTPVLKVVFEDRPEPVAHQDYPTLLAWLWASRPYTHHVWYSGDTHSDMQLPCRVSTLLIRMQEAFPQPAHWHTYERLRDNWTAITRSVWIARLRAHHVSPHADVCWSPYSYYNRRCALSVRHVLKSPTPPFLWSTGLTIDCKAPHDALEESNMWYVDSAARRLQSRLHTVHSMYDAIVPPNEHSARRNPLARAPFRNHSTTVANPDVPCVSAALPTYPSPNGIKVFDVHGAQCAKCNVLYSRMTERREDTTRLKNL